MPTILATQIEEPLEQEIDLKLQDELVKHPGKWAAITRSRLLGLGDSPEAALEQARESGVESPLVYYIPKPRSSYFF